MAKCHTLMCFNPDQVSHSNVLLPKTKRHTLMCLSPIPSVTLWCAAPLYTGLGCKCVCIQKRVTTFDSRVSSGPVPSWTVTQLVCYILYVTLCNLHIICSIFSWTISPSRHDKFFSFANIIEIIIFATTCNAPKIHLKSVLWIQFWTLMVITYGP